LREHPPQLFLLPVDRQRISQLIAHPDSQIAERMSDLSYEGILKNRAGAAQC